MFSTAQTLGIGRSTVVRPQEKLDRVVPARLA
jgi:hypothetical protein